MNEVFQFFLKWFISITSFEPLLYMICISFVLCLFGMVFYRL